MADLLSQDVNREAEKESKSYFDKEPTILYDILIYSEWTQEPEIIQGIKAGFRKGDENGGNIWGWLSPFTMSTIPVNLHKFNALQMPWKIAVSGDGKYIGILQEDFIEIRSAREEYGSILGKSNVVKDPCPKWRKLQWSPDCNLIAVAMSNCTVVCLNPFGSHLFTLSFSRIESINSGDVGDYIVGMTFVDARVKNTEWTSELILVTFKGKVKSFFLNSTRYKESHSLSLAHHYPLGITAVVNHPNHNILFVSGIFANSSSHILGERACTGANYGISAFRLLSDYPHYKIITTLEDEKLLGKKTFLQRILPIYNKPEENFVLKMCVSPNGECLSAVHANGALSIWNLPSLRLKRIWDLSEQEGHDAVSPHLCVPGTKKKISIITTDPFRSFIADINWWSNKSLIVARFSGAVTVLATLDLTNLLGSSPEWYEPAPQISFALDRGFLGLECEELVSTKKRPTGSGPKLPEEISEDEEEAFFIKRTARALKTAIYYLTDSDRFQPPKKKTKFLTKTYRLLCLKSTSPEELFARKLDNEEYGEALALAKVHKLDCDLVYQRQWRKAPVSVATIQDYLSKITKRVWVLHECLERVPENIDAARELLLYGLRGTEIETLVAIGKKDDEGRYVPFRSNRLFNSEEFESEEDYQEHEKNKIERMTKLLDSVDFTSLTLEQKQLCESRLTLLSYLDKLNTYETILGGGEAAAENFDHTFFRSFRSQTGLECAIHYAREGMCKAVSEIFSFHGSETLRHWLPILSNIPETSLPDLYHSMLPESGFRLDDPDVYPWDDVRERELDWVEAHYKKFSYNYLSELNDFEEEFYEENPHLKIYRTDQLTSELLTQWYTERAMEIERNSFLVDNALELVKRGREKNVKGLEKLHDDFITLQTLIYECRQSITYEEFLDLRNIEKAKLLMKESKKETFKRNVRQWLIPFLDIVERHNPGEKETLLRDYLIQLAKNNIHLCFLFIEASKPDTPNPLIKDVRLLITLALDCVYSCEQQDNMLSSCLAILDCMPESENGDGTQEMEKLHSRLDELERHLTVAKVFMKYGVPLTPAHIQCNENNPGEIMKLLVGLVSSASKQFSTVLNPQQWRDLLKSVTQMQRKVFKAVSIDDCFEIIIERLLYSEQKSNIEFAKQLMETSKKPSFSTEHKLPYDAAVRLVMSAAEKYFNLAASLADPSITLSKTCLNLIDHGEHCIEKELDLIISLSLLQDFLVNIIPLQVRQCVNRLDLIKQALKSPGAYKNSQKMLRLATLLRVSGDDLKRREGDVLCLLAEKALLENDFTVCFQICQQIIEKGFEEGWLICYKLGSFSQFNDIKSRVKLLGFALISCTNDLIEEILFAKRDLELQELNAEIKKVIDQNKPVDPSELEENEDSELIMHKLKQTADRTRQVLQTTTDTTKAVIASVSSPYFWKDAIKWIQPPGSDWDNEGEGSGETNSDLRKFGVHSFYCNNENLHVSKLSASYTRYVLPDLPIHLKTCENIVRAAMIENNEDSIHSEPISSEMLLDVSKSVMSEDAALSLGYLLSLKRPSEAAEFFLTLPQTSVVFELASYYFCLAFFSKAIPLLYADSWPALWRESPAEIIQKCTKLVGSLTPDSLSEDSIACKDYFLEYRQKLSKILEEELLASLCKKTGAHIDVEEFQRNLSYRKSIILDLARSNEDVFKSSLSLAQKYDISLLDVFVSRLACTFGEASTPLTQIENEIKLYNMTEIFKSESELLSENMEFKVLRKMDGTNHARLILYYGILLRQGDLTDSFGNRPSFHIRQINKFAAICDNIDYIKLMCPKSSSDVLSSYLNDSTINSFAKIASRIPLEVLGKFHSTSSVYRIWCCNQFLGSGTRRTRSEWINQYESCQDLFTKLSANDFEEFVNSVTFSETAVTNVALESRVEINKRSLKYCQQKITTLSKKQAVEWEKVACELQRNLDHLQKHDDEMFESLKKSLNPEMKRYIVKFDMTRSVPIKIEDLVVEAIMEGVSKTVLQDLLSLAPMELGLDLEESYRKTINILVDYLTDPNSKLLPKYLEGAQVFHMLEKILDNLIYESEVLDENEILEILNPFISGNEAPKESRLKVLKYLEQKFMLSPEEMKFIFRCKSKALLETEWPDVQVSESDLDNLDSLQNLYRRVFSETLTIEQLFALTSWLLSWPSLPEPKSLDPDDNIWVPLLTKLVKRAANQDKFDYVVKSLEQIFSTTKFSLQCHRVLYEQIATHGKSLDLLKYTVLANQQELFKVIKEQLWHQQTLNEEEDFDDEVIIWIIDRQLTVPFVTTPLYQHIVNLLLKKGTKTQCANIIRELERYGMKEEAATLSATFKQNSNSSSLTSALSALRGWLPRKD